MFRDSVSKFANDVVLPRVRDMDENELMEKDIERALFDNGLMGLEVDEEYGGAGASFMSAILTIEELAKVDPSISAVVDVHNTLVNTMFMKYGTPEQKAKYLPGLSTSHVIIIDVS